MLRLAAKSGLGLPNQAKGLRKVIMTVTGLLVTQGKSQKIFVCKQSEAASYSTKFLFQVLKWVFLQHEY